MVGKKEGCASPGGTARMLWAGEKRDAIYETPAVHPVDCMTPRAPACRMPYICCSRTARRARQAATATDGFGIALAGAVSPVAPLYVHARAHLCSYVNHMGTFAPLQTNTSPLRCSSAVLRFYFVFCRRRLLLDAFVQNRSLHPERTRPAHTFL